MANVQFRYSEEELLNTYEYKLASKLIKKKFPWVTSVKFNPDEINNYNIIFLILVVDPKKIKEYEDWDYSFMLKRIFKEDDQYIDTYLRNRVFPTISSFMDINFSDQEYVIDDIQSIFKSIKSNPTIPKELKLQGRRSFSIDGYIIDNNFIDEMKKDENLTMESQTYWRLFRKISASL